MVTDRIHSLSKLSPNINLLPIFFFIWQVNFSWTSNWMKIDWIWLSFGINVHLFYMYTLHTHYTHSMWVCICAISHIFGTTFIFNASILFVTVVYKCCFHQFRFDTTSYWSIQLISIHWISNRVHIIHTLKLIHFNAHFGAQNEIHKDRPVRA